MPEVFAVIGLALSAPEACAQVAAFDTTYLDGTHLQIEGRRQFFFDDLMLEQIQDVTRRYYAPEKVTEQPLIQSDQPWERVTYFTCNTWNVIWDPEDKLFKCWYEDWQVDRSIKPFTWINEASGKLCVDFHGPWPSRLCYAQSTDGINWEKPGLGIVHENGHDTNIVIGGPKLGAAHCAYVLLDKAEPDRNKRFKVLFENRRAMSADETEDEAQRFLVASSPDGIHWDIGGEELRFGSCGTIAGDVVTMTRDPETGIYWINNRHPNMGDAVQDQRLPVQPSWISPVHRQKITQENRRRVFRSQSVDLLNWSSPQPLVVPTSEFDNLDDAFYGMEQFQVGSDWVGLLNVLQMTNNTMNVQLTYSRDGRRFQRIRPGQPWLTFSGESSKRWDRYMVTICSKPIVVGDELYIYYAGASNHHDWWIVGESEGLTVPEAHDMNLVNYGLGLAKMKRDRFVSISSNKAREGLIVTPAVFPQGNRLRINARTRPGGAVRVALADTQSVVFDGFGKAQSVAFSGDEVDHTMEWKSQDGVPKSASVKLFFYLRDADLFSFQFVP